MYRAGIDVGSTTVKLVVFDPSDKLIFSKYERHFSDIKTAAIKVIKEARTLIGDVEASIAITGSGGIGLSEVTDIPFVQEVIAATMAVEKLIPQTDVVIELGGEDAKITFFDGALEQRMNGTCAGGTGAFIDQMAQLLKTDANGVNELAKNYQTIYPIASRCGVFAKTDVQPLINEGARREDIAASIFQAVVNQTIAGLAAGRKIQGNIAFLGGPLFFMSELRRRFVETLNIAPENIVFPDNSQLFVAMGAALEEEQIALKLSTIIERLETDHSESLVPQNTLEVLFNDEAELAEFRARHNQAQANFKALSAHHGAAYLGIDAGSTTTKVVLTDDEGAILFDYYGNNNGQPLENVIEVIQTLYEKLPADVYIAQSCVTGYGEHLIKNALKVDFGEVETMAHYKAANFFQPGVDFILDIGGQDMKAMTITDQALSSIQLNEACSSGCGSFIETFAKSMQYDVKEFAKVALLSKHPVDLGSKCTVFMNSKVKQVQKEGATVADISAGLSYSVIKNALYKVIKIKKPEDLGEKVVVQGGTFYNEAVLRAFEKVSGREVVRPSIAGLMGAYGCALIAQERAEEHPETTLLSSEELAEFTTTKEFVNCGLCENQCSLTLTVFNDGRKFVTGNRCERGAEKAMQIKIEIKKKKVNLVDYKYKRLFSYKSLSKKKAAHGTIGIPRVLNMYENYPLWHTILTDLGFRVVISPRSDKKLYEKGMETISSDTVCYPAKMAHGHIESLIEKKVDKIFYPSVIFEQQEQKAAENHFNCPIVQSYPEVIEKNIDAIRDGEVGYLHPFVNLADEESVVLALTKAFAADGITEAMVRPAVSHGFQEMKAFKVDLREKADDLLMKVSLNNEKAIVLAGRPYHLDPEINHGIANVITQEGFHVLTEDMVSDIEEVSGLRVVNQWVYHSRLYAAAKFVAKNKNLELVQLNSFGCGLDAVTTDQVEEIMRGYHKLYTVLKIDEGSNLGAIRIRLRSLKAAVNERDKRKIEIPKHFELAEQNKPVTFTKEMRKKHTLLMPMLSPIHQEGLVEEAFKSSGYHVVTLPAMDRQAVDVGLKYVNNDSCYPAIISIGQLIKALESGDYDLNNTSVMMSQTGGGCRATNYIPLLRKALKDAGFEQVPVVSVSMGNKGVEDTPGFKITIPFAKRMFLAAMYGDLFERVIYRTRPYELEKGQVNALYDYWVEKARKNVRNGSFTQFNYYMKRIIKSFDTTPISDERKPRVGVVGEILVKYAPTANNDIVGIIESEGAEAVVPDLIGFMNYSLYNQIWKSEELNMSSKSGKLSKLMIDFIEFVEKPMHKALVNSERFDGINSIYDIANEASNVISIGNHTGEGWFLTGEMIELLENKVNNIVCLQPFGCLPNHIVGKGMIKELRRQYPKANIAPIDYDPGVSVVNQLNRIRLMMATAKKEIKKENMISR
ncbi:MULTISPECIES: 2-hydroxyacyl-CoA dehydratase [unclassified Enterococcus]|uniref:2-hydroxyacyl-CoA dehydratase n=1 Tax=unclassified Enterococcus TaxID=2608891 RepID=UPI0015536100|nr:MULTISPECIES: 2-hydroxyacyl-CoA dehydratase [unclassified Enterococcus]MBS7576743.1 2-hydroxyacyl-CoA dehydratase [Enterococcus sp. MMGLQ5-2]MBS7583770.1 2-hydroxyacyl-CoA dehydratase [Enterococcus sp. MMGLQ5-1]NPD11631.1 2-hydroxyacyl-CoA dehydratase [Enterococcus sp. MMGLQ5-1]NPD36580.1 2-hydroxyacyl-CoA dehydratase [Enterococcus sp. MMGLQ5-2]